MSSKQSGEHSDWFEGFTRFMKAPRMPPSPETKQLGTGLVTQARADLREFRRKYDSKDYPRALFWLQQAAEKAVKGLLVIHGFIHPKDLKGKIGHLTPMAFLQIVESEELGWMPDFVEWVESLTDTKSAALPFDVREARRVIKRDRHDIAKLTPTQVNTLIRLAQSFKTVLLPLIAVRWKLYRLPADDKPPKDEKGKELIARGDTKDLGKPMVAMFRLYIISLITFPHWDTTRYPGEGLSPVTYTTELGVVARVTTLASMLAASLRELESDVSQ